MLKTLLTAGCLVAAASLTSWAQVTTKPDPLQEDATGITIYFHADEGNKGLMNLPEGTIVYAHTGVITSASKDDSDWKYAPTWCDNSEKYALSYVSENLYSLYIGNLRSYYGITNPSETVEKLAFVFRNANGSKEGKAAGNKNILVNVEKGGLQVDLQTSLAGDVVTPDNANVHFTLTATEPADLSININGQDVAAKTNATLLECDYIFTEAGSYNVYGNAVQGDKRKSKTLKLTYTEASPMKNYPGGTPVMGAVAGADGEVTFCVAAPGKTGVYIVSNRNDYQVDNAYLMNRQDVDGISYFWYTIPDVKADEPFMYYYYVDSRYSVCDPYANLVLDPSNDRYIPKSVFPDLPAYPSKLRDVPLAVYQPGRYDSFEWTDAGFKAPEHSDLLVYELLLRDFTGTEGKASGNGTIRMALEKLPYLKQLGINAIELLPVNEFNGNNSWGYNPNFYFAPDKAYGTPADYKEFVNACHEQGIAVILDMVFNQSDWLHPWYRMYEVGENPMYNATAPHAYSVLNDWNQGHPLVRRQWKDVVKYWMEEYHVDGYRFDLVKGLGDNDSYADNGDSGTNAYNASRIANMRAIQEAMIEINPDAIFINENLAGADEENAMAAYGQQNWANINNQGCQYAMGYSSNSSLNRFYAPSDSKRLWGSTVSYLESHDEQRLAYQQITYGDQAVKGSLDIQMKRLGCAAAQMILAPGAHMIWQFSELGNDENTKDATGGNNTSPKKVLWSYFDVPQRRDLYYTYASLAEIRRNNPELFAEEGVDFKMNCSNWNTGRTMTFATADKELYLAVNPRVQNDCTIQLPFRSSSEADYTVICSTPGITPKFDMQARTVTIPANSFVVIGSHNVSGVESVSAEASASETVATEWYSIDGLRLEAPVKGLVIRVDRRADGSRSVTRQMQ